ncbi:MAG: M20/M25/M40 family metallo-hydrolase [Lachnospiraceae bacterium]|nr:M20/M25/M40 family metallo-hydrolase [Lachnospiraceae bacterium]
MITMIQNFSDAFGPSGFEDDVLKVAREYAADIGSIEEDCMRNLYIYRKENTGNKPVLMLDAHSDEVGFMVHSIKPNGTLRFVTIGGWNKNALPSSKVLVRNADGDYIPGIIAAKPVHFMTAAEKAGGNIEISSLIIDVGAISYEDAVNNFHIRIGEPVVPATTFAYDAKRDVMFGKAFDCRIGCAVLIEALRRLSGKELPCDVVGVLSSQEEVGERGAMVSVKHVKPDVAIVLEGCPADDTFTEPYAIQTALKKGPMIRFMDTSIICSPRFQRFALDLAEEKGLLIQSSVREGGGNDGAVINTALDGVPVIVAGVPVRYIHSMNCMTSYTDFEATVTFVVELIQVLTEDIIKKF